jgi:ABC-type branched-subunit amino acid transport system permease subunit
LAALYGGEILAAMVGALVDAMATRLRRPYLYLWTVVSAVVIRLLFFVFVRNPGDGPLAFGTGFSMPVAAVLTRVFLKILYRHNQRKLQVERVIEGRL